ncbi:GNAT family N-acetyltransferase [Denitrobaculum tricleocarpae]|uniref:GNAT family N-acetyltransferase n=1 Tax=Denitrobaculum tricleocarpae TaxID=2591009 RepID=A0A545TYD7_9PROT|nr:GNAT family N-acetyltransferase [Denitrobaculum tricleocarpae]TQV82235.1 GNAT family N-acetyltransferase [Denitrobaculum tricleocarpae]
MKIEIQQAREEDGEELTELRVDAMRESLEAVGRFEPKRARERFLNNFDPQITFRVLCESKLIGFYALQERESYLWLDHFYIAASLHGRGIGSQVMEIIKNIARSRRKSIRLGALKESRANAFYLNHGFVEKEQKAWDIYYEWAEAYS